MKAESRSPLLDSRQCILDCTGIVRRKNLRANMLGKFIGFRVGALAASIWALSDPSCAVAESTTPKEATPPQKGTAKPFLTLDVLKAFRAHILKYWLPPPPPANPEEAIVSVRFSLSPDGRLAGPPKVMTSGTTEHYIKARDAAVRAVLRAQPFTMLLPVPHEVWKELEITFDPRDLTGK